MPKKKLLICVVGPTAIGKTSLAIELANAFNTEILSADSRQFFKEMEIGTAVPSKFELAAARHHFIQHKSVFEQYTVGTFEKEAIALLDSIFESTDIAILVGGSGLYIDAVTKGLDYFPEISKNIRVELNQMLETKGILTLQKELQEVDPIYYKTIDNNNPRRLIRALEIYRGTGKKYSSYLKVKQSNRNFDICYIGLRAERSKLYQRINSRVDLMVTNGLLQEAEKLYANRELNALQTVGYREIFQYLNKEISLAFAIEEIKKNTRRFAKRQGTWFRKNKEIRWFDYKTPHQEIIHEIEVKNAP